MPALPTAFQFSPELQRARTAGEPIVALESTVITHGLPYPENIHLAEDMEKSVRENGAVPATVAVLDGKIRLGLSHEDHNRLGSVPGMSKISARDLGPACAGGKSGGTTVAGTIYAANRTGIQVMATGGIGGVHRHPLHDVSSDLVLLGRTPIVVVCAGAKAILDLPGTVEYLETLGVPVVGYQTDRFPAFYARDSGLPVELQVETPGEVATIARTHWRLGMDSAVLVVVPPPQEVALPMYLIEDAIEQALDEAERDGLRGQGVTPFLLHRVNELTGGASLRANLGLLRQNASIAARIAGELVAAQRPMA